MLDVGSIDSLADSPCFLPSGIQTSGAAPFIHIILMVESQRAQQKPFDGSSSSVTHTFTVTYILLAKASLMVELEADDGGKSISSARKGTTSHMP